MADTITASAFRKTFGQTLDLVKAGKRVVLTNHNRPWVQLAPPQGATDGEISAFDLRLNAKVELDKIYHSKKKVAVIRKGKVVAIISASPDNALDGDRKAKT